MSFRHLSRLPKSRIMPVRNVSRTGTILTNIDSSLDNWIKKKSDLISDTTIKTENKVELGSPQNKKFFFMVGIGITAIILILRKLRGKKRYAKRS